MRQSADGPHDIADHGSQPDLPRRRRQYRELHQRQQLLHQQTAQVVRLIAMKMGAAGHANPT